mmetsp:Transcript_15799/g.22579  ORF Transcript_15799/g.22579 Transcript_15799/m.22579 type:complete len:245 (-) Transcript_15799:406-1140(-)
MTVPPSPDPSVKTSFTNACGTLPSVMNAPLTPSRMASVAKLTLGIIPPVIVSSSIKFLTSCMLSFFNRFFSLSNTPAMSVKKMTLAAFNSPATRPAATSALTLYTTFSSPFSTIPHPIGAITGVTPISSNRFRKEVFTLLTLPTKPKSTPPSSNCFSHSKSLASRPDNPIALPPALHIPLAMSLFTCPQRASAAPSTTSADEIRIPLDANDDSTFNFFNRLLICGPPPCTTTTFNPSFCNVATS